jgi:hypothetical protein
MASAVIADGVASFVPLVSDSVEESVEEGLERIGFECFRKKRNTCR